MPDPHHHDRVEHGQYQEAARLDLIDHERSQCDERRRIRKGGDHPVAPAIATIPPGRVLCVYGEDEHDTACTDPLLSGIKTLKTKGGHHFDEDYPAPANIRQHENANVDP
ncbi:virulence factor [Mesorhizobium australicum]|uniref:Virulence factor n=1 Tax=Mesorhizobium australicum TaxID=536018 RepID=A0ACC6T8I0_9HYPH